MWTGPCSGVMVSSFTAFLLEDIFGCFSSVSSMNGMSLAGEELRRSFSHLLMLVSVCGAAMRCSLIRVWIWASIFLFLAMLSWSGTLR